MDLQQPIFDDESGVSPVIGVILMVAVTVIIAAVIGSAALGLGDSVSESPPQASLSIEQTELPGDDAPVGVKITQTGGDDFSGKNVQAVVEGEKTDIWSETDTVKAGDAAYVVAPPGGTVDVVYDAGDSSTQLRSQELNGDASSTVNSYSYGGGTYDSVRGSGFSTWSQNPRPSEPSTCGAYGSMFDDAPAMIGGVCEFGGGDDTQRQYDLPAGTYKIGFTGYYQQTWDNERLQAHWNGDRIWQSRQINHDETPIAGDATATFDHTGGSATLRFDSTLNSGPDDESWGINNVWIVKTD